MTPDATSLWLISVESGSLAALEWLLDHTDFVQRCAAREETKDNPVDMLLLAASKHASDLHAHMTVLLLSKLSPYYSGRLAGDGTDTTLLHRCVGFANANLVQCAVETLLASIPGSSIEVRDAFGDTPIVYACAAGNLATLCFLVKTTRARLENEYEGQSSFYYTLQLLPSFAWRWIVGILLATHCNRGFLHCDAEDRSCGCKGWEDAPGTAAMEAEVAQKCGFCNHDAESHRVVPHPPWFMDQYETYAGIESTSSPSCESISDP
uniref:Uncharacterized protein n=1 Tax=Globisporangium ultimum (strain ATCC 200006 / CBS 805.95 / DAOM BR144) TaxID=431595 RepID=K3WIT5_GLOUD